MGIFFCYALQIPQSVTMSFQNGL